MTFSFALGSSNISSRHARRVRPVPRRAPQSSLISRITHMGCRSSLSARQREQQENARALFEVQSNVCLDDYEETQDYCDVILPTLPYQELKRTPLKRQRPTATSSPSPSAADRVSGVVRSLRRKLSLGGTHH